MKKKPGLSRVTSFSIPVEVSRMIGEMSSGSVLECYAPNKTGVVVRAVLEAYERWKQTRKETK